MINIPKFKGKRLDNGEWVIGNLFFSEHHGETALTIQDITGSWTDYLIDSNTLEEYTGIDGYDMMGDNEEHEIFTGDIVCVYERRTFLKYTDDGIGVVKKEVDGRYVVDFCEYVNGLWQIDEIETDCISIIGNIHDNPELFPELLEGE